MFLCVSLSLSLPVSLFLPLSPSFFLFLSLLLSLFFSISLYLSISLFLSLPPSLPPPSCSHSQPRSYIRRSIYSPPTPPPFSSFFSPQLPHDHFTRSEFRLIIVSLFFPSRSLAAQFSNTKMGFCCCFFFFFFDELHAGKLFFYFLTKMVYIFIQLCFFF